MSDTPELRVTSLDNLRKYAEGTIVNLPPFAPDQPFVARLRRPSMMAMAKQGKIPNELLSAAQDMFQGRKDAEPTEATLKQTYDVLDLIAEASLVEPKYKELCEAGITLTDEQMIAIFQYSQRGVQDLKPFRKQ